MRKVLMLLTCTIILLTCLSAFENETLTLSFDIEEGTDSREFGFSPVPLVESTRSVETTQPQFPDNTASIVDLASSDYSIIGKSESIYVYWKILSSEEFELELSGEPLKTVNSEVSDEDMKTIHYGVVWSPLGYGEEMEDSVLGFGLSPSSIPDYTAEEVYRHSPSTTQVMRNHDCIELVITTEDASSKVPGEYTATLTLGIRTTE